MNRTALGTPDESPPSFKHGARRGETSVSGVAERPMVDHFTVDQMGPQQLFFSALGTGGYRHTARDLKSEMAELRAISTRATITPGRFMNVYNFGDFKGNP